MTLVQIQALPFFLSVILSLGVIALIWRFRSHSGGKTFIWMMLALSVWAAMAGMEVISTSLAANLFWSIASYPGVLSVPVLFFLFVTQYTGYEQWLSRRNLILVWTIPVVTMLLALTNQWHHLHWSSLTPDPLLGEAVIHYGHGPWFYVMIVFLYLVMLVASPLLFQAALNFHKAFRFQTLAILVSIALPWIGNFLYILGVSPMPGIDMAPIFFSIAGLIFALAIFRFRLLDLVPVAREMIIEGFQDGILVMDDQDRIVDVNRAAKTLLNLANRTWVGESGISLIPQTRALLDNPALKIELQSQFEGETWLELHLEALQSSTGRILGRLLTIRNITERKQMELILQEKTRELERLAVSDSLTGLFNRRYIETALRLEFERCERYPPLSMAIAMFDIDLFKGINDRFGHPCGDEVIRCVSRELTVCIRASDIAGRFGGDEFIILFPQCTLEDAWQVMDRLRNVLAEMQVPCTGKGITISGGVTAWYPGDNPNAALQRVDHLLYQAKARSRNLILKDARDTAEDSAYPGG
jgi:diguanylate cyclase (GGDEF)-like protein